MKVLAYLNLHHAPRLGPLTKRRSTAVVSFLGRKAIMDFMLSNFSNRGFSAPIRPSHYIYLFLF